MAKRSRTKIIENVKVDKVGFGWVGISRLEDGKVALISWWVLPWMIVDIKILRNKKDYIKVQAVSVKNWDILDEKEVLNQIKLDKQNLDINNTKVCKHNFIFDTAIFNWSDKLEKTNIWCGWCKWQILPYKQQLKLKEQVIKDSFNNCDFFDEVYNWIVPCDKVFNYRNKMEFSFWKYITTKKYDNWQSEIQHLSDWSLWFHKQGQFSKIVDINNCLIAWEKINKIYSYLKNIFQNSKLPVYDQKNHTWFLRHFVVREGTNTWEVFVNLDVAPKYFKEVPEDIEKFDKLKNNILNDSFIKDNITTFLITENDGLADVVRWKDVKIASLFWPWYIFEKLFIDDSESKFRVSPFSFFQTNTYQAQKLFKTAKDMLPEIKWNILDLYCWAWTIWITFLNMWIGENLLWVEIVPDAVKDANYNAKLNNLESRTKFIADKAENINFEAENIWLIVIDPPRSWLHKNVVEFLWNLKTEMDFKLLYISCNPVTMARDLKMLMEYDFKIKNLKSVDMFPHTHHMEMVGILE